MSSRTSSRDSGGQDGGPSSRGAGITPLSIFDKPEIWSQSNASLTFKSAALELVSRSFSTIVQSLGFIDVNDIFCFI